MTSAVYPGSFDPITNGHVDIARRAAGIFELVTVAVYDAPPKNLMFTTDDRVAMARQALADVPNVRVVRFSGLTVEFAKSIGAKVLIRGLRAISDFETEFQMALMNRNLAPNLEVVCFMTSLEHTFISSSIIKEVAKLGGPIEDLVPPVVARALRERYAQETEPSPVPRHLNS